MPGSIGFFPVPDDDFVPPLHRAHPYLLDRLAALPWDDAERSDMGSDGSRLAVPRQTGDSVIPLSPD
jgi:hypothetical protein